MVQIGGIFELDDVEVILELNVDQLVGSPEFRVNRVEEFDDLLVEFSFGDLRSLDEEGDPIVTAVAVEMSS